MVYPWRGQELSYQYRWAQSIQPQVHPRWLACLSWDSAISAEMHLRPVEEYTNAPAPVLSCQSYSWLMVSGVACLSTFKLVPDRAVCHRRLSSELTEVVDIGEHELQAYPINLALLPAAAPGGFVTLPSALLSFCNSFKAKTFLKLGSYRSSLRNHNRIPVSMLIVCVFIIMPGDFGFNGAHGSVSLSTAAAPFL